MKNLSTTFARHIHYILFLVFLIGSCAEDPGEILATSDNPYEINRALYRLGQDTLKEIPQGLEAGAIAPYFAATDQEGRAISLGNLAKEGPVVLLFYRGYWCGICSRTLSNFQDSLHLITDLGASVVAVTPEVSPYQERNILRENTNIAIISDAAHRIMTQYKVAYEPNEKYQKNIGIDLKELNGAAILPVPATYIINKEMIIQKTFFTPDFRERASINEIVQVLRNEK